MGCPIFEIENWDWIRTPQFAFHLFKSASKKGLRLKKLYGEIGEITKIPKPIKNFGKKCLTVRDTGTRPEKRTVPAKAGCLATLCLLKLMASA